MQEWLVRPRGSAAQTKGSIKMKINKSVIAHAVCAAGIIGAVAVAQRGNDQREHDGMQGMQDMEINMPELPAEHPLAGLDIDPMKMMEAWMKTGAPSKSHDYLKSFVGDWTTSSKFWMDPTQEPMESSGRAKMSLMFDGRFLKMDTFGDFMGQPMKGFGLIGFSNVRKQFEVVWMDSMGTGMYTSAGSLSFDGSTLTTFGQMDDPFTGELGKTFRWSYIVKDDNNLVLEGHEVLYGEPFKVMEISFTRSK